jgi:hypothetical protein
VHQHHRRTFPESFIEIGHRDDNLILDPPFPPLKPQMGKVMTSSKYGLIIFMQLYHDLIRNKLITSNQSALRPGDSFTNQSTYFP